MRLALPDAFRRTIHHALDDCSLVRESRYPAAKASMAGDKILQVSSAGRSIISEFGPTSQCGRLEMVWRSPTSPVVQRVTIRRGSAMWTMDLLAIAFLLAIVFLFSGPTVRHP